MMLKLTPLPESGLSQTANIPLKTVTVTAVAVVKLKKSVNVADMFIAVRAALSWEKRVGNVEDKLISPRCSAPVARFKSSPMIVECEPLRSETGSSGAAVSAGQRRRSPLPSPSGPVWDRQGVI